MERWTKRFSDWRSFLIESQRFDGNELLQTHYIITIERKQNGSHNCNTACNYKEINATSKYFWTITPKVSSIVAVIDRENCHWTEFELISRLFHKKRSSINLSTLEIASLLKRFFFLSFCAWVALGGVYTGCVTIELWEWLLRLLAFYWYATRYWKWFSIISVVMQHFINIECWREGTCAHSPLDLNTYFKRHPSWYKRIIIWNSSQLFKVSFDQKNCIHHFYVIWNSWRNWKFHASFLRFSINADCLAESFFWNMKSTREREIASK